MRLYIDRNDWWVGYYRGPNHHYVCPLPTVVIRWPRRIEGCPVIAEGPHEVATSRRGDG